MGSNVKRKGLTLSSLVEFDVKAPLKIKEEVPPEKVLSLRLMREVKEELEGKR
jgi:hypothetical protein